MKAAAMLRAAWCCTEPRVRTMGLVLMAMALAAAAADGIWGHDRPGKIYDTAAIAAMGVAIWWGLVGSGLVILQRDWRSVRLPQASRLVAGALLASALVTVVLPAALMTLFGGAAARLLAIMVLGATAGLLWAMLPGLAAAGIALIPLLDDLWGQRLGWPRATDPGFARFALEWAAVFALLILALWRWLLRADLASLGVWTRPQLLAMRCRASSSPATYVAGKLWRREIAQRYAFFAHMEPFRRPIKAMGILLGPPFAPIRLMSAETLLAVGWGLLVGGGFLAEMEYGSQIEQLVWASLVLCFPAAYTLLGVRRLRTLFAGLSCGDMAEMALLPRLEAAWLPWLPRQRRQQRLLLRATLGVNSQNIVVIASLPLMALVSSFQHPALLPFIGMLTLVFVLIGNASATLYVLAGRWDPRFHWRATARFIVAYAAMAGLVMSTLLFAAGLMSSAIANANWLPRVLAAGWSVLIVMTLLSARRSLRIFRQRPHPFLQR